MRSARNLGYCGDIIVDRLPFQFKGFRSMCCHRAECTRGRVGCVDLSEVRVGRILVTISVMISQFGERVSGRKVCKS